MKISHLSKTIGLAALSFGMMLPVALPASAQDVAPDAGTTGTTTDTTTTTAADDEGFDWGLLGLLGLIGLAGLAGKKNDEPTRYRDPNTIPETEYRR